MSEPASITHTPTGHQWKMPPLILHPFSDSNGPGKLVESSRASMMLQGLLPNQDLSADELDRKLLDGRYCEIRMLFYVGKDLVRWIDQCMEMIAREESLQALDVRGQSFAQMLVDDPPELVRSKLRKWGVADYRAIFSRALGLNSVFGSVPERKDLADPFIRNYYRFADQMYACYLALTPHVEVRSSEFNFDLFASGEYSRMLEKEWASSDE